MNEYIVSLKNAVKKYKDTAAVNHIDLQLKKEKIYGLVGKNGAGKTTMMRMIAGLSIPTQGSIEVKADRVGTLIEAPGLNGNMNAKENLKFYRMLSPNRNIENSDEALLNLVGLENSGKKKVKDFSLGMRQRLGIAIALLGNPDFVMLDEPVNGLDPVGVVEIRNLIQKLNHDKKITFLISSHNLPELFQTATDFIIMDKGVIKKEITQEELEKNNKENLEEYFLSVIQEGETIR